MDFKVFGLTFILLFGVKGPIRSLFKWPQRTPATLQACNGGCAHLRVKSECLCVGPRLFCSVPTKRGSSLMCSSILIL